MISDTAPNQSFPIPFHQHTLGTILLFVAPVVTVLLSLAGNSVGFTLLPLLLLGLIVLVTALLNPFVGLLLALINIFSGFVAGFELAGGYMALVALTSVAWLFHKLTTDDLSLQICQRQFLFIALLLSAMLLSVPFALDRKVGLIKLIDYVKLFVLWILIQNIIRTRKQFKLTIVVIISALVISFVYGIYSFFIGTVNLSSFKVATEVVQRIQGVNSNPNSLGASLVVFTPIPFLFFFAEKKNWKRSLSLVLFAIFLIATVLTFSRGAIVSLAFVILIIVIKKRHHRAVLWGSLISCIIILILIPSSLWERFEFVAHLRGEASARWRFKLFLGALNYFIENPFLGIGLGNFIQEAIRIIPKHQVAHNMYLEIAAETGLLGLIAFLGLIWTTINYLEESRLMFKKSGQTALSLTAESLKIGFFGFLISAFFLSLQADTLFWAQIGMFGALRLIAEDQAPKDDCCSSNVK